MQYQTIINLLYCINLGSMPKMERKTSVPPPRVTVFDTTLRDGEQAPGCSMTADEKLCLSRQLEALGVDIIEAGFPIASDGDFAAVQAIARHVRRPRIAALARA